MIRKSPVILVVEHNAEDRDAMANIFSSAGYDVVDRDNGQSALDYILSHSVDIVLTDMQLPVLDGFELLRRSKQVNPAIEVILITGCGNAELAVESIKNGAYDFITKPVGKGQLLRRVEKAAEKHYLSRVNRELP
jgi:two-component system response regulator HydG